MIAKLLVLISLLLAPSELLGQRKAGPQPSQTLAADELEIAIAESTALEKNLSAITVRAKSAALLSYSDPDKADEMFRELWKSVRQKDEQHFDQERAETIVLKYLFPRNPKLAKRLLSEAIGSGEPSLEGRATGRDPSVRKLVKLSSELMYEDPATAAALLQKVLSMSVSPASLAALTQLREKDSLLADYVVANTLEQLKRSPSVVSLSGLYLLASYLFPTNSSDLLFSVSASSLASLQVQYFSAGHDILTMSLAEDAAALQKDSGYSQSDLRYRALFQAQLAAILTALAPRYQPGLAPELTTITGKLLAPLPPNVAQMAGVTAARLLGDQPSSSETETAISEAIASGNFDEASSLIAGLKDEDLNETFSKLLHRTQAKHLLAQNDVLAAVNVIRKLNDTNLRLVLSLEAIKVAYKKNDRVLAKTILSEARTLVPKADRNGMHVRALLTFAAHLAATAAQEEAFELLHDVVLAINSLPAKSDKAANRKSFADLAWEELNDPAGLLEAAELKDAFASMGTLNFEQAIIEARKIQYRPLQLMAKLNAVEAVVRMNFRKSPARPSKPSAQGTTKTQSSKSVP